MARRPAVGGREPPWQPDSRRAALAQHRRRADRAGAEEHGAELRAVASGCGRGGGSPAGGAASGVLGAGAGSHLAGGEQGQGGWLVLAGVFVIRRVGVYFCAVRVAVSEAADEKSLPQREKLPANAASVQLWFHLLIFVLSLSLSFCGCKQHGANLHHKQHFLNVDGSILIFFLANHSLIFVSTPPIVI